MDEKRKHEIGYKLLLFRAGNEGVKLNSNFKRELGNIAKGTGISLQELEEFTRAGLKDLADQALK
ncbi:MAG TPA: hypothetical protein VMV66_02880 [Candidatus Humimicrobiaceae bacterium]|nr:hypothetical protein [Candidatus Humimicrobiaceae bacterium]